MPISFPLSLCYLAMMALAIGINLLPVFLTTIAVDPSVVGPLGELSKEQLGRLSAITFVGLVSAILVTGPLVDRAPKHGPKFCAILGNLLVAVGLLVLAKAPSYMVLMVACYIMGFGSGTLDMVLSPIVAALQPHRRTVAMNMLHSFYCIGAVASILAGAWALEAHFGWRSISLWLIVMPVLVAAGFLLLDLPPLVPEGFSRTRLRVLIRAPFFLLALAAIFLGGATELGMAYWLPTYAEQNLHYTQWTAGMAFLCFSLAMAVGRIAVGALGNRVPAIPLLLVCCGGSVVLFLAGAFLPWPALALGACVLAGLTGSCLWPSVLGVTADHFPHGGASMFGLLAGVGNAGGIVMPWLVGVIADHAGLALGLATGALCPALMIAVLLGMRRPRAPHEG